MIESRGKEFISKFCNLVQRSVEDTPNFAIYLNKTKLNEV